jgi:DNA repair photolyase
MKRFTGHTEPWGSFIDIKINAPDVLRKQLNRSDKGAIIISSVTDPYQPIEKKYMITRKCLEILAPYHFPIDILTKSPLVVRDIDILLQCKTAEVGVTITTDNEKVRRIFEPQAPPIQERIEALKQLKRAGIKTYVFIGPVLPMDTVKLAEKIKPLVDSVLIDRLNYAHKVAWLYRKYRIGKWLDDACIYEKISELEKNLTGKFITVCQRTVKN